MMTTEQAYSMGHADGYSADVKSDDSLSRFMPADLFPSYTNGVRQGMRDARDDRVALNIRVAS